jgi:hypothetical protein
MATAYTLGGTTYDVVAPEETINGTTTINGKFNVTSNGKTITLTNPSKATLKYYIETYGNVTHVQTGQKVTYGSDKLFHFIEIPKQIPYNPPVTPDIPTNDGNVCEYWDAPCHIQQGLDWAWGGTDEGVKWVQGGIDIQVKAVQDAADKAAKDTQDAFNATIKAVQDAAIDAAKNTQDAYNATIKAAQDAADKVAKDAQDAFDATIKAAQDAAAAAAKAAADAAAAAAKAAADAAAAAGKGVVKPVTDMMIIGGVAALGIGLLLVMKK